MDPVQSALQSFLSALQAQALQPEPADLPAPPVAALLSLLGQEVELKLLSQSSEGAALALPSGQVFTARGDLPYADGTSLVVRVQEGGADGGARLQLLEARAPSAPAILAPLFQGEGTALLARLAQPEPAPGMAPLVEQFLQLKAFAAPEGLRAGPDPRPIQAPVASLPPPLVAGLAQPVPGVSQAAAPFGQASGAGDIALSPPDRAPLPFEPRPIEAAVASLPPALLADLKQLLQAEPGPSPGTLLLARFQEVQEGGAERPPLSPGRLASLLSALEQPVPGVADGPREALVALLKTLAAPGPLDKPAGKIRTPAEPLAAAVDRPPAPPGRALGRLEKGVPAEGHRSPSGPQELSALAHRPSSGEAGRGPGDPDTWLGWIRSTVKALVDPAVSPREAPFHAAQAKEGTAYFELPLPWSPQTPLQLWVESDPQKGAKGERGETQTVLLGLSFTRLGEIRLGVARHAGALQVRVWAEHPEGLMATQAQMEAELRASSPPGALVDLRILSLQPSPGGGFPSLKSILAGSTLQLLG